MHFPYRLIQHVGEAKVGGEEEYELSTDITGAALIVTHKQSGATGIVGMKELVQQVHEKLGDLGLLNKSKTKKGGT